ncbi:nucleotidyltransferase-like protein [Chitinophaga dinghuensis]|uniref:Nucleotidyltransferase-like protein n=1 Tax=Chitinophaga dinghuensis TaxID=1539050 RepID=A0A327W5X0_9BACT|nr:nucleotidyltransferase family protein [Chitinophaga dinghuensis]RAJ85805.1 nucleotidyltransferase-like protein [Chitinophaga dinghuensis]
MEFRRHLIHETATVYDALSKLNQLAPDAILFVTDINDCLIGSLTDGDIRRGFIQGFAFDTPITSFVQPNPIYINQENYSIEELEEHRNRNIKIIPILNDDKQVIDVLNFRLRVSLLPVNAVIMAGGKGERLLPLTLDCPKPLLKVGQKPIIEHNVDRLANCGIEKIIISVRYLGDQIKQHFGNGVDKSITIDYVEETTPLGTFGALSLIDDFDEDHILLMNSDLLTNIDFVDFYRSYIKSGADLMIASIPYQVKVPYAVLEIENGDVISFDEKPTYNYYSNGGIYLFKKSLLTVMPQNTFYNATDFMEELIAANKKVSHYPILGYWLDIGRPEDYEKAQEDIKHIKL